VRSALSFDLTKQQDNALSDIMSDFAAPYPMLRLLQGDVGTGKTLVAALAALAIVEKRWQCAICIPRVQLAKQFRDELKESVFSKLDGTKQPTIAFVGEGTTKKEMDDIRSRLWWNTLDIVVGTTSVQNLAGNFSALGLVVVDEEQKFGSQNKVNFHRLAYKDADVATSAPHYLAMSATPIPRSLALANFGVMSISRMDGLPPAGNGVTTLPRELSEESKQEAMQCVEEAAKNGRQTYVVCSRVEEQNESSQSVSVERMVRASTLLQNVRLLQSTCVR
jgi:ATP-dependent DNA helicase RecG